jgi:hypothetical protein
MHKTQSLTAAPQAPHTPITSLVTPAVPDALSDIGAIALEGSGFENETPLPAYTGADQGADLTQTGGTNG